MKNGQLSVSSVLLFLTLSAAPGWAQCPGDVAPVRYHSLPGSKIALPVNINGVGPFEFLVDTGSQITIVEPSVAAELRLRPQGSVGVIAVANKTGTTLVGPTEIEVGAVAVPHLAVAVLGLTQLHSLSSELRGILGEDFLARLDVLIDYRHKVLCFDETKRMRPLLQGDRVPLLVPQNNGSGSTFMQPLLVSVHLPGDGRAGTVLRLDSGSNAPVLYSNRADSLPRTAGCSPRSGSVAGNGSVPFVLTTPVEARLAPRVVRQIAFLTPLTTTRAQLNSGEDGLLPTMLFQRVFISYAGGFVIFDPRWV